MPSKIYLCFKYQVLKRIFLIVLFPLLVSGHGRLLEPAARNTLWRFGYKTPPNYNDNELFCGGIGGLMEANGKCGVCGDKFYGFRIHETGGIMAVNKTVKNYFPGSSIDIMVEIFANHGGEFSFQMCWRNSWDIVETEDCFEPMMLSNGDDVFRLDPGAGSGFFATSLELPSNRTCTNCIMRWHWRSANNWGVCEDGSEMIGCGLQEIYRNCADISVDRAGRGIGLGNLLN